LTLEIKLILGVFNSGEHMKLWKNGVFHTMCQEDEKHHQMGTHQGYIIGFDDALLGLSFDEEIDLEGAHVYPGFVDAHLHILGYGQMLSRILLHGKQASEVIHLLKQAFQGSLLYAEGYMESGITKDDLNQISRTIPIYIRHQDYHSLTVNDAVLNQLNYTSDTGVITEDIAQKAIDLIPKYSIDALKTLLKDAIKHLYQYGVTGGHSDDLYYFNGFHDTVLVFEEVLKIHPFRTHLLMHHHTVKDYEASKRIWMDQSIYLQLGAVKMFYDGTISSETALMVHPYRNRETYGMRVNDPIQFVSYIKYARSLGLTVAVHVIGDQGLDESIDILKNYPPKKGQIDRLIHTPYVKKETLLKLKGMPLSIDIQPQFLSSDLPWALDKFTVAPDLMFPWKSLMETGLCISGSSDAPVEIPNPLLGIHAAVFRRSRHDGKVYFPEESLTRFEAIKLYTTYAHIQSMKDDRGYLKPGYIADMTVTRDDLMMMEESKFFIDQVVMTIINEQIVYRDTHKS